MALLSAREEILRQLRASAYEAPLPDVIAGKGGRAGLEVFVKRAAGVGVEIIRAGAEHLARMLADHAASAGVKSVVIWEDELLSQLREALSGVGIALADRPEEADAGITTADFAIAETGTLVLAASRGRPRATSLVPPRHIVVLPEDRIVGTLFDLLPHLDALPSALTFITGPSRTADIELTPVRGVHGPISVTVFLTG